RWRPKSFGARLLDGTPFGRALALSKARSMTKARTGGHYPAPFAALRVLEHGYGRSVVESLQLEVKEIPELLVGPVCKNLVRIFLWSEAAKKSAVVPGAAIEACAVERLALLGAGVMGGGIAEIASRNGIEVRVRDVQAASLTRALQTARALVDERI